MNRHTGYTRPTCGGHYGMVRLPKDGYPKPIKGKGGRPKVYPTEVAALKAVIDHLCRYWDGHLRRDGVTLTTARSEAEALFKEAG